MVHIRGVAVGDRCYILVNHRGGKTDQVGYEEDDGRMTVVTNTQQTRRQLSIATLWLYKPLTAPSGD